MSSPTNTASAAAGGPAPSLSTVPLSSTSAQNYIQHGYSTNVTLPKYLEFLDEEDERQKCLEFKESLIKF